MPITLELLSALNSRALVSKTCVQYEGVPRDAHFGAVQSATGKVVTDRDPEALLEFVPVADSIFEISCSNSDLSARAEVDAEKAPLPIPADLRARLDAIAAQSCEVAENDRPNPRYVAQTPPFVGPSGKTELELLDAFLNWVVERSAEPHLVPPQARQILPVPPLVVQKPVASGEGLSLEDPKVQFAGGAAAGAMSGAVPLGPQTVDVAIQLHVLEDGTYYARVGRACGEIVSGVVQIGVGCAGISTGAGMSGTGGGALVGVPVISASYAILVNGCATLYNGVRHAGELYSEGAPPETPAPSSQVKLLEPKPKPAAQAPGIGKGAFSASTSARADKSELEHEISKIESATGTNSSNASGSRSVTTLPVAD